MEQAAPASGGTELDGQRGEIGYLHGGGVPNYTSRETVSGGLTSPIPGINARTAAASQRTALERPMSDNRLHRSA